MSINIITIHIVRKMIDLHTHLLQGMDDGARDLEDALALFSKQKQQGVNKVVLTPHFSSSSDDLNEFIARRERHTKYLKKALKDNKMEVDLKQGAEILYSVDMFDLQLDKLCLEKSDYLLIEFSTRGYISDLKRAMANLLDQGYLPIFAHIERYGFLRADLSLMKELVEMGVLFQVNASSFLDKAQQNFLKACIKHNLIHLVASDAHSIERRPCNLGDAYHEIEKQYGKETVNTFIENAERVFNNELVQIKSPSNIRQFLGKYY